MYGGPRSRRRSARRVMPYNDPSQYAQGAQNLTALATSGQFSWLTSPIGLQTQSPFLYQQPQSTAVTRRGPQRIEGFTLSIPSSLSGLTPSVSGPSGAAGGIFAQPGQYGMPKSTTPVDDSKILFPGIVKMILYFSKKDLPIFTDAKVDVNKIVDSTASALALGAKQNDSNVKGKILPFTDKINTDEWAEVLSPMYGRIMVDEPVKAVYPSPMHYVEAMKIASLSSGPFSMGGTPAGLTPCDNARQTLAALALQPYATIIKSVADTCKVDLSSTNNWLTIETARGRFWFYLWLALWAKFSQNQQYAAQLVSTGGKILIYYSDDPIYGQGQDGSKANAVGFLLMILRGIVAAGWAYNRANPVNAIFVFKNLIEPAIAAVYKDNAIFIS